MLHHKLVLPEFLNHYGNLFGGHLLNWIDEVAFMTVSIDYPGNQFLTIGLDSVVFKHSIVNGEILRFDVTRTRKGTTSATYNVKVYGECIPENRDLILFETNITFVAVDDAGCKTPIVEAA